MAHEEQQSSTLKCRGLKPNQSVGRALKLLLTFIEGPGELSATEIATRIGVNRTTVLRLLLTLEQNRFLMKDAATHRYSLGPQIMELAGTFLDNRDLTRLAHPEMHKLRVQTGETISLFIQEDHYRLCILQVESLEDIRRSVKLGQRVPLWVGASGKVFMAYADGQTQEQVLAAMRIATQGDESRVDAFQDVHVKTRQDGFAISVDERGQGAAGVSAPVLNRMGQIIAVLGVGGPVSRLSKNTLLELAPAVVETAKRISKMLVF